jgi:hypothetical protein
MEAAVRYLREGAVREDSAAPLMLICDSLETLGGPALFLQVTCIPLARMLKPAECAAC